MPDVIQLGRMVKAKYPGVYDDLADGVVGQKVKAKFPGAYDDFADTTYTPPTARPPEQSMLGAMLSGGAEAAGQYIVEPAVSLYQAGKAAVGGNFQPLGQMAESAGRGVGRLLMGGNPSFARQAQANNAAIARLQNEREQRLSQTPAGQYVQKRRGELAAEAARDQTTGNKVARGVGRFLGAAAPAVATGALTGGSLPAIAGTTALQSAAAPENAVLNVGLSVAPIPAGQIVRSATNAIRRVFGKGAAQIIEAEAAGAALPPASGAVSPTVQRAMQRFEQAVAEINASGLSPAEKAAALETSIQVIGREASGIRPVSAETRRGYPPAIQEFPENPNPIQVAGELPAVPGAAAETGAGASMRGPGTVAPMKIPASQYGFQEAFSNLGIGDNLKKALRESVARTGKLPSAERGSSIGNAFEAAVANGEPRTVTTLDRILAGETGAPSLEAEIGAPQSFGVRTAPESPYGETVGPSVSAPMNLDATLTQAAESIPRPIAQRVKDEFLGTMGALKSLKSSFDISAPLRQAGILLLRPLQWRQSGKALGDMFRAFRSKDYQAIHEAIATHPEYPVAQEAGLELMGPSGVIGKGEEAFARRSGSWISEKVAKIPGIKQSDQMFTSMMDSQRFQRFLQFKKSIDKLGLSPEEAMKGYKAAAQAVNVATGRGSLGQTIDKSFEALNYFLFSPRFIASRLNVFNPVMYLRNAATPAGRAVLKGQISDLAQFAATVASALYMFKSAGAQVETDPASSDFLKIRFGNWRYDIGAGLQQVMRLFYRVGADIDRATHGEKPTGKTAIDIGETFLSYKLSPPAAFFRNFINQRTPDKKPFSVGQSAADLAVPMQWADFVDAYQKEAWGGVAKTLPGAAGVGVQNYQQSPVDAAIERAQPLLMELKRLDKQVSDLRKQTKQEFKNGKWQAVENEDDASFNARVQQFGQNYTLYGLQLLDSPRFRQAPDSVKVLALDALNERAKKLTTTEFPFPELTLDANTLMDGAEASAAKRNPAIY